MPDSKVFNMPMEVTSLFENRKGEFVFCHPDSLKPYSVNAPRALLKRMDRDETLHGFREYRCVLLRPAKPAAERLQ